MKHFLYFVVIILLLACESKTETSEDPAIHHYRLVKISSPIDFPLLEINSLLTFYEDGHYTLVNENSDYTEGLAKIDESSYSIFLSDTLYKFDVTKENQLLKLTTPGITLLLTESDKLHFDHIDLLSKGRNWWRVKPQQKETEKEVEQRVVSQLNYIVDYFQMLEDSEARTFSTQYLNLPVKLYGNGIALPSYSKLPDTWKTTFYDEENALHAYKTLTQALNSIEKYPKDDKSHAKSFIKALEMMITFIES